MRLSQTRARVSLVFAALIGGCRGSTEPAAMQPTADGVNGFWNREDEVPGSGEQWSLVVRDTLVTGEGGWSLETCCSGSETIVGHIRGGSLQLSVTSTRGPGGLIPSLAGSVTHSEYVAVLLSPTEMSVAGSTDPTTMVFRMHKQ
jgi:hypothetical protein